MSRPGSTTRNGPSPDGREYLSLLASSKLALLLLLYDAQPIAQSALPRLLGTSSRTVNRQLGELTEMGIVECGRDPADRRQVECRLTDAGHELVEIAEATRQAIASSNLRKPPEIAELMRGSADPGNRLILHAMLSGPQPFSELLRVVSGITKAALSRHLDALEEVGLVETVQGERPRAHRYALSKLSVRLRRAVVLAARWRWRWTPLSATEMAGDLTGLAYMLQSLAHVPPGISGVFQLHIKPPVGSAGWTDTCISVSAGHIRLLALPKVRAPTASVQAEPLQWCDALLDGDLDGLEIEGDLASLEATMTAMADALQL